MKRRILFVITNDPRKSALPAEAIRIAAGVGTWKKVEVLVYLHGPAVLALSEYADEFIDEDNYVRYFPILGEWDHPVYVQKSAPLLSEIGDSKINFQEIDSKQMALMAATCQSVLTF